MARIELNIIEPTNNAAYKGVPNVSFRGALSSLPQDANGIALYYRWYSSLNADVGKAKYSMNAIALTSADTVFTQSLGMGSHVITFAVSDRPGETDEDFQAMSHGGVTGGEEGDGRCLIHVFKAKILDPQDGMSVSRANLVLSAEAPASWEEGPYQGYNRLCYHWQIALDGTPPGSPPQFDSDKLHRDKLEFVAATSTTPPAVKFRPMALPAGNYKITLTVEDALGQVIGSDPSFVNVTLS